MQPTSEMCEIARQSREAAFRLSFVSVTWADTLFPKYYRLLLQQSDFPGHWLNWLNVRSGWNNLSSPVDAVLKVCIKYTVYSIHVYSIHVY